MNKIAYDFTEAAEQVGFSRSTIERAVAEGELVAHYRKGVSPRIFHTDLEAWVESWPTERAS